MWEMKKLVELFNIARGGSPRPIKNFLTDSNDGVNWIKISDATKSGKYITKTKEKIKKEGISKSRLVHKGDFILSNSMSFGRPYIMGTSGCIHDGWLVLSSRNKDINPEFLYYLLSSPFVYKQFDLLAAGSTVRNLNIDLVSKVSVPNLPLKTQQAIVAKLDKTFAELEKLQQHTEQNLINANELFNSYLNKIFTTKGDDWVEKKLGDVCEFENGDRGKNYPSRSKFIDQGIAFINAGHLDCGVVNFKKMNYITEDNYNLLSRGKVRKKDVLFCLRGSLGKYAVIKNSYKAAIASSLVIIRPSKECTVEYLALYLQSSLCNKLIQKYAGGAAQPNLGAKDVAKFYISLPPLKTQQTIVSKLDKLANEVNQLKTIYNQKLKELAELKQSILEQAFNGKLNI